MSGYRDQGNPAQTSKAECLCVVLPTESTPYLTRRYLRERLPALWIHNRKSDIAGRLARTTFRPYTSDVIREGICNSPWSEQKRIFWRILLRKVSVQTMMDHTYGSGGNCSVCLAQPVSHTIGQDEWAGPYITQQTRSPIIISVKSYQESH